MVCFFFCTFLIFKYETYSYFNLIIKEKRSDAHLGRKIMTILEMFPRSLREKLEQEFQNYPISINEIRIRVGKPIILKIGQDEKIIMYKPSNEEVLDILNKVCDNSIYTYQSQLCDGFITVEGGHRVGVSGNVVVKDNKVININYICSLNFRIAKQIKGCSDEILQQIVTKNGCIENSLIVSAP